MNELSLICFLAIIVLFLYSVYRQMFVVDKPDMIAKWKIAFLLIIVSSMFFFIYLTSAISGVGVTQTIDMGSEQYVVTNNSYLQAFNFLPMVSAIYLIQWLFFVINILQGFGFFGRTRMRLHE